MAADNNNCPTARLAALGAAALFAVAGCRDDRQTDATFGQFPTDNQERAVDRFATVQSAAAARADATLNGYHFDGANGLNSLGRQKLDGMTRGGAAQPLVVYIDLPHGTATTGRHEEAVRTHLADRGLSDDKLEVRDGPNPDYTRPAKDGIRGLKRLEADSGKIPDSPDSTYDTGGAAGMSPLPTDK